MASGSDKKHKCSCGRTFRHAISLKRHQNVTGCETKGDLESAPEKTVPAKSIVEKPARTKTPLAPAAPVSAPSSPSDDDRTVIITPELVASWQAQTGFQRRSESFVDSIADKPAPAPKVRIDWAGLARTGLEFVTFCGEVKDSTVRVALSGLVVLARSTAFLAVLTFAGWLLVTKVSASDAPAVDQSSKVQLAAQTVVQDFLQNARLNQYSRAMRLLAPSARQTVSAQQLRLMLNSLPLEENPTAWRTEVSDDSRVARVTITRCGMDEVYTLVLGSTGWGLTSVAVANT